jgi:muconolactone delta-isomerase
MKILALEKEIPGVTGDQFQPHLRAEAARVWELLQASVLREIYFSQDEHTAVLILECADAADAQQILNTLPLVDAGLITFDVIPLVPYPGLARLFAEGHVQ